MLQLATYMIVSLCWSSWYIYRSWHYLLSIRWSSFLLNLKVEAACSSGSSVAAYSTVVSNPMMIMMMVVVSPWTVRDDKKVKVMFTLQLATKAQMGA